MILRNGDYQINIRENMMGGDGCFVVQNILRPEQMHQKGRLFARGTLAPGHSVGYHVHKGDMEVCYFLSGTGTVIDQNGCRSSVHAGDCNIVESGEGHAIINSGTEDLVYIALILYI